MLENIDEILDLIIDQIKAYPSEESNLYFFRIPIALK